MSSPSKARIGWSANKVHDSRLLVRTLFAFCFIRQRWKCFPVTLHSWNVGHRGGVNGIHSACAGL